MLGGPAGLLKARSIHTPIGAPSDHERATYEELVRATTDFEELAAVAAEARRRAATADGRARLARTEAEASVSRLTSTSVRGSASTGRPRVTHDAAREQQSLVASLTSEGLKADVIAGLLAHRKKYPLIAKAMRRRGAVTDLCATALGDLPVLALLPAYQAARLQEHGLELLATSASKAASEPAVACYRDAFLEQAGVAVATARAGNVIGGGDWSEDRLLPDAVRAWQAGQTLDVRRPQATRPWQHVLEPLGGYLRLAERLWAQPALAGAWNFGPRTHEAATVRDVITLAREAWQERAAATADVRFGDGHDGPHETAWLSLEIAKARALLDVRPRWGLAESVGRTMRWYAAVRDGESARARCLADLDAWEQAAP
jgi:hypothetical protein